METDLHFATGTCSDTGEIVHGQVITRADGEKQILRPWTKQPVAVTDIRNSIVCGSNGLKRGLCHIPCESLTVLAHKGGRCTIADASEVIVDDVRLKVGILESCCDAKLLPLLKDITISGDGNDEYRGMTCDLYASRMNEKLPFPIGCLDNIVYAAEENGVRMKRCPPYVDLFYLVAYRNAVWQSGGVTSFDYGDVADPAASNLMLMERMWRHYINTGEFCAPGVVPSTSPRLAKMALGALPLLYYHRESNSVADSMLKYFLLHFCYIVNIRQYTSCTSMLVRVPGHEVTQLFA